MKLKNLKYKMKIGEFENFFLMNMKNDLVAQMKKN